MHPQEQRPAAIQTDSGDVPLQEYRLGLAGRTWSILHTHAMLTYDDELHFFRELRERLPYGVALWPAAIALAHEIMERKAEFAGRRVLELGAGTGLPCVSLSQQEAREHFGWFYSFAMIDQPTSSESTRAQLGWKPREPGLLIDMQQAGYFG